MQIKYFGNECPRGIKVISLDCLDVKSSIGVSLKVLGHGKTYQKFSDQREIEAEAI